MTEKLVITLQRGGRRKVMIYGDGDEALAVKDILSSTFTVYDFQLQELDAGREIDAFVITEQMIAYQAEFNKIMDYCGQAEAGIYDSEGRDLYRICKEAVEKGWCSHEELLYAVEKHDYISFDIFDTLLTRKVMRPEDVFDLVEKNNREKGFIIESFKEKRIRSQEQLGLSNPDISEIYKAFQDSFHITPELAQKYLDEEIAVEKRVLVPRKDMVLIFKECLDRGKKVFLVTDMYISEEVLREILKENGITGYNDIYVSCSRKQLKLQGLLETYVAEAGEGNFLHIGDHLIHDGICAGLAGIDYCLIPSGYKCAMMSPLKPVVEMASSLEEHILIGLVINRLFSDPFSEPLSNIKSDEDYAYSFCAAYVARFVFWISETVEGADYRGILFSARDGFLIRQMYDILRQYSAASHMAPESIYFYTSRKAAVAPCVKDEKYINTIIDIYAGMDKEEMMREGFLLEKSKVHPFDPGANEIWHLYIWEHLDAIRDRAAEAKRNYLKYMGNLRLAIGWKYAFMDWVSSGTCQKSLIQYAPFEMEGLYAYWKRDDNAELIDVKSMIGKESPFFIDNYKKFETFLTSLEPSVIFFDEQGEPVFAREERTEKELRYIQAMQRGCMEFFTEFLALAGRAKSESLSLSLLDCLLAVNEEFFLSDTDSMLNQLSLVDDWNCQRNPV